MPVIDKTNREAPVPRPTSAPPQQEPQGRDLSCLDLVVIALFAPAMLGFWLALLWLVTHN